MKRAAKRDEQGGTESKLWRAWNPHQVRLCPAKHRRSRRQSRRESRLNLELVTCADTNNEAMSISEHNFSVSSTTPLQSSLWSLSNGWYMQRNTRASKAACERGRPSTTCANVSLQRSVDMMFLIARSSISRLGGLSVLMGSRSGEGRRVADSVAMANELFRKPE